jgi:hypothetical protein
MYLSKNKERELIKLYPKTEDADIAKIMGVSLWIIRKVADELGLKKAVSTEWDIFDITILDEKYPTTSNERLSSILNRSKMEIEHFAFRFGIEKDGNYFSDLITTDIEKAFVDKHNDLYTKKELGSSRGNYVLGQILDYLFPLHSRIPEYPIGNLRLDWYIPRLSIGLEYDGIQHKEYSQFFHGSEREFSKAQERDYEKSKLCEKMGIAIARFSHNEKLSIPLVRAKISEVI